ncbi:MAG: hypothetical protein KA976_03450 [Paludibacteraceae bacterium]|jgi:hypothetical protein|nr:hypothetical protein [Paludibacteraceae bacterium]
MRKIFLTFIVFAFAHTVFSQNKQTTVIRPETAREKEERKINDVVETFQMLGEFGKLEKEADANNLNRVKNSKYSVFVEKKLETWKKKGTFEKTTDWQKRLNDSTEIKKTEIIESAADEYARALNVLQPGYYDNPFRLNDLFYNTKGQYDSDKEVLVVNTFWGNIPIPIPLDKAKNWQNIQNVGYLEAHFFIQNDQLALLSLSKYDDEAYTWENPSQSAQIARNKKLELEQIARNKRLELVRLDSLELARYNHKLDSIFEDYNRQLLQNPYNLYKEVLTDYSKIMGKDEREYNFNRSVSSMQSDFEQLNNSFRIDNEDEYQKNGKLFTNKDEFDTFYKQGVYVYKQEIEKRTILNYFTANRKVIESMDFQKEKMATIGSAILSTYTGIYTDYSNVNAEREKILSAINDCRNKPYYSEVINFVIENNKGLNKEWTKNGKFFESKSEFYNAYISNDYKNILKSNKKKNVK